MIIYPALDLHGGQVVRLRQGDPSQQTTYSADPSVTAQQWIDQGAAWLHVVNLDGALGTASVNESVVRTLAQIATKADVSVQFGGGLRSAEDIARAFDLGVTRLMIGTLAVSQPDLVTDLIARYGADRIVLALDGRDGKIVTHGWQQASDITPVQLGKQFVALGARHALYTDVGRDGMLGGVDVTGTADLARATGLQVIASGGLRNIEDVRALTATKAVAGVILGKALYEGLITVREALAIT